MNLRYSMKKWCNPEYEYNTLNGKSSIIEVSMEKMIHVRICNVGYAISPVIIFK